MIIPAQLPVSFDALSSDDQAFWIKAYQNNSFDQEWDKMINAEQLQLANIEQCNLNEWWESMIDLAEDWSMPRESDPSWRRSINAESQWSILQRIDQCQEAVIHPEKDRSMPRGNDRSWRGSIYAKRQWLILKKIDQIIYHLNASCLSQWTKTGEIGFTCHQKTGVKKLFSASWSEIHLWLRAFNFFCFSIPDHIFLIFTTLWDVKTFRWILECRIFNSNYTSCWKSKKIWNSKHLNYISHVFLASHIASIVFRDWSWSIKINHWTF